MKETTFDGGLQERGASLTHDLNPMVLAEAALV
ncbi:MAG: hypothetical protein ACJAU6_001231 [Alphaproteobacteria bacterium]|jgi:hypothetical protein